jgi:MFS family permease
MFMIGAAIFAGFSLLAGLVPGVGLLIAARMSMAIGGALMWPAILGMTYARCPIECRTRGGLILGVAGLGNAVRAHARRVPHRRVSAGGGLFFVNLPITAFAMFVTARAWSAPALLLAFFRFERSQGEGALVPSDVLSNRVFAASCLATC